MNALEARLPEIVAALRALAQEHREHYGESGCRRYEGAKTVLDEIDEIIGHEPAPDQPTHFGGKFVEP